MAILFSTTTWYVNFPLSLSKLLLPFPLVLNHICQLTSQFFVNLIIQYFVYMVLSILFRDLPLFYPIFFHILFYFLLIKIRNLLCLSFCPIALDQIIIFIVLPCYVTDYFVYCFLIMIIISMSQSFLHMARTLCIKLINLFQVLLFVLFLDFDRNMVKFIHIMYINVLIIVPVVSYVQVIFALLLPTIIMGTVRQNSPIFLISTLLYYFPYSYFIYPAYSLIFFLIICIYQIPLIFQKRLGFDSFFCSFGCVVFILNRVLYLPDSFFLSVPIPLPLLLFGNQNHIFLTVIVKKFIYAASAIILLLLGIIIRIIGLYFDTQSCQFVLVQYSHVLVFKQFVYLSLINCLNSLKFSYHIFLQAIILLLYQYSLTLTIHFPSFLTLCDHIFLYFDWVVQDAQLIRLYFLGKQQFLSNLHFKSEPALEESFIIVLLRFDFQLFLMLLL